MRKQAKELRAGDKIEIAGEIVSVENVEISDMGKQGSQKARISAKKEGGEKIAIIRPSDYPFTCK